MIRSSWWKILAVLLLMYTIFAGMLVPLTPGIIRVNPTSVESGTKLVLKATGYNTRYTRSPESLRAWLKMDDERALAANSISVIDDRRLEMTFLIPDYLPVEKKVQDFTLVVDDAFNGASLLPSAVFVTQAQIDYGMGVESWYNRPVRDLHERSFITFPFRNILAETIRNTYFHVALWLAMVALFLGSLAFSIRYLSKNKPDEDLRAHALTAVGLLFGLLGLVTGAIWAKNTWGAYWSWDVKQNMTVVALLIYCAYFILRGSFEDPEKRARVSAVYNIFAFTTLIPLIYVIPRLTDSLHPGAGGNPAFGSQDLDNTMRMIFYPAVIGWALLGYWMASLLYRIQALEERWIEKALD